MITVTPAEAWEILGPSGHAYLLALWDEEQARDEASNALLDAAYLGLTLRDHALLRNHPQRFLMRQLVEHGAAMTGRVRQNADALTGEKT